MELKCLCLNVTVSVQQTTFGRTVDLESLRQENEDDPFDGCCLKEMDVDIAGISMEQRGVVSERLYGDLRVFKCHGCRIVTHCLHQHKPGRLFVNFALIKEASEVTELRQSDTYSDVFRFVLPQDNASGFPDVVSLQRKLGTSVIQAQQLMDSYVMEEEAAAQARIQAFVEEQNMGLTRVKQRAQQDLRSLYAVMSGIPAVERRPSKTEAAPTVYTTSADRPENMSALYPSSSAHGKRDDFQFSEGVFSMDDFEPSRDEKSAFMSDNEDDDTSTDNSFQGSQVGLAMPTSASNTTTTNEVAGAWMLGKSAPVNMPGRMQMSLDGTVREGGLTPSFEDIGNSIKALAQSVQDQSMQMFGELPRPRTATSFIDALSR